MAEVVCINCREPCEGRRSYTWSSREEHHNDVAQIVIADLIARQTIEYVTSFRLARFPLPVTLSSSIHHFSLHYSLSQATLKKFYFKNKRVGKYNVLTCDLLALFLFHNECERDSMTPGAVIKTQEELPKKKEIITINIPKKTSAEVRRSKNRKVITLGSKAGNRKVKIQIRKVNEVNKHLDNVRMVLLNSNATPIQCYGGIGYKCCFCTEQFPEAKDLKKHTLELHDNDEAKTTFMKRKTMLTYIVKLDITSLTCKLCDIPQQSLENLVDHLVEKHGKIYHKDIKSHIVPFNFQNDGLKCVICKNDYNNFKVLLEHMNVHFKNHVCEVCGCGFINRRTLLSHGYRHKTGTFQCTFCTKVYNTKIKQRDHERAVHICLNMRNKCGYCGEKFSDYRKKKDHEVKRHGARPVVLKCQACGKLFDNQRALTVHVKTYHVMERRLPK